MKALGMIETYGFIGSVEAADVMLKCADVSLLGTEKVSGGLYYISIIGDVGAVKTAVDAGAEAVRRLGNNCLQGAHVIPRPDDQLADLHHPITVQKEVVQEEPFVPEESTVYEETHTPVEPVETEEDAEQLGPVSEQDSAVADSSVETTANTLTFKEYKRKVDRARAAELREMVARNPRIEVEVESLKNLVRREMIALLLEDFKEQDKKNK